MGLNLKIRNHSQVCLEKWLQLLLNRLEVCLVITRIQVLLQLLVLGVILLNLNHQALYLVEDLQPNQLGHFLEIKKQNHKVLYLALTFNLNQNHKDHYLVAVLKQNLKDPYLEEVTNKIKLQAHYLEATKIYNNLLIKSQLALYLAKTLTKKLRVVYLDKGQL